MSVVVTLTEQDLAEAQRLGDATWELFKTMPGYYGNRQSSHRLGKYGEVAVEKWPKRKGLKVESVFRDIAETRREDLVIEGVRVEVKTWDARYWADMGRCVTPRQLQTHRRKADVIVWCSVDGNRVTSTDGRHLTKLRRSPSR